jgi:hypothetical protein
MSYQTHIIKGLGGYKTIDCFTFGFLLQGIYLTDCFIFLIFIRNAYCLEVNKKTKKPIKLK